MRLVIIIALLLAVAGCRVDRKEVLKNREPELPAVPVKVDLEKIEKQGVELRQLFDIKYTALQYEPVKNPFETIIDDYKKELAGEQEGVNPLLEVAVDEMKLTGILTGKVGNIGLINIAGKVYYLKEGDILGKNKSTVLFIGDDYLRLRKISIDIFGNRKSEIRDIKVAGNEESK